MKPRFDVRIELTVTSLTRVTVRGEVDLETSGMLFEVLICALSVSSIDHVEVDMTNVTLLDASGVGVLLAAQNRAQTAGKRLDVCAVTALPLQVLEITGVLGQLHAKSAGTSPDGQGGWQTTQAPT